MSAITFSLSERLRERIRRNGPITFHDWMEAALYDPQEGYYRQANRERWGREGDYRTSPEMSVLFAGTFAGYVARLYDVASSPPTWTIVESGAGAGHFAEVILETLESRFPHVFSATHYVLDETSSESGALAANRLAKFGSRVKFGKLSDLEELSNGIIFANELIDSFPVHRVTMRDGKLREFFVAVSDSGAFEWKIGRTSTSDIVNYFKRVDIQLVEGQIAEVNLQVEGWLRNACERLRRGYLIMVDYGLEATELFNSLEAQQGRLRGYYRHGHVSNILANPGEHDITTTVDWTFVKCLASDLALRCIEFERQDRFLLDAGLLEDLEARVSEVRNQAEETRLRTTARAMILPDGMAASFQVLVLQKGGPSASPIKVDSRCSKFNYSANSTFHGPE